MSAPELTNISVIRALMDKYGFAPSKGFGQNFIINPAVCPRIAELSGCDGIGVIEIGPGIGVLTRELAARAKKVTALEIDRKLLPVLEETLADCGNTEVINADVMQTDLAALIAERFGDMPVCICANLPYYITTPVILRLLEAKLPLTGISLMVQKEAAARLCAQPGAPLCGAASATIWYYCVPERLFEVSRGSFFPAPEVDSVCLRLSPNPAPPVQADEARLFATVKAAFAQRRKTAANSISAMTGIAKADIISAITAAGAPANARAEALTLEQLAAVSLKLNAV